MESTTPVGQRCARCGHAREGHGTRYAEMFGDHTWTNAHGYPDPLEETPLPTPAYRPGRVSARGAGGTSATERVDDGTGGRLPPASRADEPWWRRILRAGRT